MFVAKALEYTLRRVVLLTVNRSVLLQNTVDDIREGGQFRAFRWLASPISRRFRMPQHLPHRLARNAKPTCRLSLAQTINMAGQPNAQIYRSTVYILPPSISKKIEGYRWQSFTPPAAGKSRRFRGLICHRRSQKKARLDRGALDLQAESAKKAEESKVAGAAQERLSQFRRHLGADARYCPECFILRGNVSVLEARSDRFVATGDRTFDEYGCQTCGYKLSVRA